jgi:hypothetical protein
MMHVICPFVEYHCWMGCIKFMLLDLNNWNLKSETLKLNLGAKDLGVERRYLSIPWEIYVLIRP